MAMAERRTDTFAIEVKDPALAVIMDARNGERDPESLALYIEVSGASDGAYTYDMWFQATRDAGASDVVQQHGDLAIVIVGASVEQMLGATLDVGEAGLVLINPNTPPTPRSAVSTVPESDLSSPIEIAVLEVLQNEVNPQIAAHGGRADLVAVDADNIAYLRLSGGCQGCGLAQVTLSQGISVSIKNAVPQIADVIDITAHGDGTDPYFEASKK